VNASDLPQRQSLVAQTAGFLRGRIEAGAWRGWLPSERSLCELLQVSRNTLRAALAQLRQEGRIESVHGSGNRILPRKGAAAPRVAARDVALLTPESLERLRPLQTLWIDEMRALLSERGVRLRVFHGAPYYAANPGPALQRLVTRNPHGCWIPLLATEEMQRWFARHAVPCILAGSAYPGLDLPYRDLDHRAICRHAAGAMLGLGHRRLALLTAKSRRAGDLESEAGFREGVKQSRHPDAEATVLYHDESVSGVVQAARRVLKLSPRPTALLVVHPYHYLALTSRLAQAGVRVPEDISIVSRDDDPFLAYLAPAPTRYAANPLGIARSLVRPVLELLEGNPVSQRAGRIMPEFVKGESLAAMAAR
jgi:LacI family transcriptional regulator